MGQLFDRLSPALTDFLARQPLFFVATAAAGARINLSPKGMDTFRVLSDTKVAYLDLTGSGNETAAHLHADGRMTLMFCSFDEKPLICRLFGHGHVIRPHHPAWPDLIGHFTQFPNQRQIIALDVESVGTSCGFGVPEMAVKSERPHFAAWTEKKGPEGIAQYWVQKNQTSIDGLPTHILDP